MSEPPIDLSDLLVALYMSEINASLSWLNDRGFDVAIGDQLNGWQAQGNLLTLPEVVAWLRDKAIEIYPQSKFAAVHGARRDAAIFTNGPSR